MSDSVPPPSERDFRLGTTFWVVVGSVLLLGIAIFAEPLLKYFDRLTVQQYLFRLDFRYWPPGLAYPLWLIFGLLLFDAITYRKPTTETKEVGKWRQRYISAVFAIKVCLAVLTTYFLIDIYIPIRGYWIWLYSGNLLLFAIFLTKWSIIYKTRTRTDFTTEILNVRRRFLIMSLTITGELGIFNFLQLSGLLRRLFYPLWYWFGYGAYSHWGALAFFLICAAIGVTLFVIKEWLVAIKQVKIANRQTLPEINQQVG